MAHKTELVESKVLSDGAIAVRVRCCNDETTDSWITIYHDNVSDADIEAMIAKHHANVEAKHVSANRAKSVVEKLTKKK